MVNLKELTAGYIIGVSLPHPVGAISTAIIGGGIGMGVGKECAKKATF